LFGWLVGCLFGFFFPQLVNDVLPVVMACTCFRGQNILGDGVRREMV
jgi:hypothetical protein